MHSVSVSTVAGHRAAPCPDDQPGLLLIPEATVRRMRGMLRAQTPECVMASFGISMNTWTKVRDGHPIRRSVGERLLGRLKASAEA